MSYKYKILIAMLALAASFAFGRYTVNSTTKTTEDTKVDTTIDSDKNKHKETTTVTIELPSGEKRTTTTTTEDSNTIKHSAQEVTQHIDQTITKGDSYLNVSALAGLDVSKMRPVYGASVSKEMLGPITLGAFGMTNGLIGLSIGLNF